MRAVFIHGRAQEGKDPKRLFAEWGDALLTTAARSGVSDGHAFSAVLPYYGDALASFVSKDSGVRSDTDQLYRSARSSPPVSNVYSDIAADFGSVAEQRARATGGPVSSAAERAVDANFRGRQGGRSSVNDEFRKEKLNAFLRVVDSVVPAATDVAMSFLEDVSAYFGQPDARKTVLSIVDEQVRQTVGRLSPSEPLVIVAHSLGSVVAHDYLSTHGLSRPVSLLVTLGSPLGMRSIYKRLLAFEGRHSMWPSAVKRWVNASDPADVVALVPALGRLSLFSSSAERGESERCDVLNLVDIENKTPNRHGITGYLSDAGIARAIFTLA